MQSGNSRSRGFTLLEVLVALIVLSIGLLGLTGLQTAGLRNNHSAFMRSQAVAFAYDALDRMRGNRDQAILGPASAYNTNFTSSVSTINCASNCTSLQVAQYDLAEWKDEVARLPTGQGQISIDADNKATVSVRWADNRGGSTPLTISVEALL
jgi:type IV pilus assembly protein PilV